MASRNSVKIYAPQGIYHIYNRGVEKREIFLEPTDCEVFLSYLKTYLLPKDEKALVQALSSPAATLSEKEKAAQLLRLKNFSGEIDLLAYCLLPNHFHFLIRQEKETAIDRFMNAFGTRYSMYFNKKYKRVGPLFQGVYKACLVYTDEQLLYLSRYIHLNPFGKLDLPFSSWQKIPWPFSFPEYLGKRQTRWVKPALVLDHFRKSSPQLDYLSFVSGNQDLDFIKDLLIDNEDE